MGCVDDWGECLAWVGPWNSLSAFVARRVGVAQACDLFTKLSVDLPLYLDPVNPSNLSVHNPSLVCTRRYCYRGACAPAQIWKRGEILMRPICLEFTQKVRYCWYECSDHELSSSLDLCGCIRCSQKLCVRLWNHLEPWIGIPRWVILWNSVYEGLGISPSNLEVLKAKSRILNLG